MARIGIRPSVALVIAALAVAVPCPRSSQAGAGSSLFTYLGTESLTPSGNFLGGGFVRIYDSPTAGRVLVTFNTQLAQPEGGCSGSAHVYKEYTAGMQATGVQGTVACVGGDIGSLLVGNSYYLVSMEPVGEAVGWKIGKYDAVTWALQASASRTLNFTPTGNATELPGDQMVVSVNGQLDFSSQYNATGTMPDLTTGAATYHWLYTPDLQPIGKRILAGTPHIGGSSMLYLDGVYYLVTATAFFGDVVVITYDANWNYLGVKTLLSQAHWSEGLAYDGQRFYVAYMDTSERTTPNNLPVNLNVRLAAFDADWDLIEDIPVTSFTWSDLRQPGRPYILLHGSRLYVSYDCDTIDPVTHEEETKGQAYIAMYEIAGAQPHSVRKHLGRAGGSCPGGTSALGVLRSTDHGATWASLGNACMQGSPVWAVDPTGYVLDGKVVLYFVDFAHLNQAMPQSLYRAVSSNGVSFDAPQAVYTQTPTMVDPGSVLMADGSVRIYVPSEQEGIISLVSSDGEAFARDSGVRTTAGGMPGAVQLPDGRVRLFLCGSNDGQEGIFSMISRDGLDFTAEAGVRISSAPGIVTDNPQPIRLVDGSYLMVYQTHRKSDEGSGAGPWDFTEIHLATSTDALNWTPNSRIIGYGGTSCVVEMPDGTLYIYLVNR